MYKIEQGDCRDILEVYAAAGMLFDSCVTDPPYHLTSIVKRFGAANAAPAKFGTDGAFSRASRGFMGQQWDGGDVAFDPATWRAVYDVLKPGAYLLAFSGTRTYHRMVCAIEDAGFEIRDQIAWVYGCLSEDTEILIDGKWEHYSKAIVGSLTLCYNVSDDTYEWLPIEDTIEYDYSDTAYRIQSDNTDQIVSRNHRSLVERGGRFVFQYAETLECEETIPVLENLPALLHDLRCSDEGASESQPILRNVQTSSDSSEKEAQVCDIDSMCSLRNGGAETECVVEESGNSNVLLPLQRHFEKPDSKSQQVRPHRNEVSQQRHERGKEPCMERRCNVYPQEGKLQTNQVREVSRGIPSHGTERWIRDGAQIDCGSNDRAMLDEAGSSSPRRSRPAEQCGSEPGTVCLQPGSQVVRGTRYTYSDMARITPFHYYGKVWCVKVPTGAFVARRNGKVFITGNSGFPKSHDVSKAIDKAAGAEREIVGTGKGKGGQNLNVLARTDGADDPSAKGCGAYGQGAKQETIDIPITAPATDDAQQWEGWGTALKPAFEPIVVARKPLIGTVAQNVLEYGTGGINIDGCRIELADSDPLQNGVRHEERALDTGDSDTKWGFKAVDRAPGLGRWPANLIHDGSDEVLECFPEANGQLAFTSTRDTQRAGINTYGKMGRPSESTEPRVELDKSAARFFYCAKASKKDRAGSTHPTVKPIALMRYLCRLVTPPNGTLLDPFAGSGSTGQAALEEGFSITMIEQSEDYVNHIKTRMESLK